MAQSTIEKKARRRLILSILVTVAIFASVYFVYQNYDSFLALFQKDEEVGAAQSDPLNGSMVVMSDFSDAQTMAEILTDAKTVGLRHYVVDATVRLEKNCSTGKWSSTPLYSTDLFWSFMAQAASQKQQVYLGLAELKGSCVDVVGRDKDAVVGLVQKHLTELLDAVTKKGYKSTVLGLYIPQDSWVSDLTSYDSYYTTIASMAHQRDSELKVMVSPYRGVLATYDATKARAAVAAFVASTDVDIIAPQTAMGTQGYTVSDTKEYLMMWRDIVDRAQKKIDLWANIDLNDKFVSNGRTTFAPSAPSAIINRIDAAIPYVGTITSFGFQHYMAQSNKLSVSTAPFLITQKYSPLSAVQRYEARAGYLMHYQLKRTITDQKWSGSDYLVTFTDTEIQKNTNVSVKVVYLTIRNQVKTAATVKALSAVSVGKWSLKLTDKELALVDKAQPMALFIKAVTEKEKALKIE